MKATRKVILEENLDERVIQFTFDEDTPLGLLYMAADKFRNFVYQQIQQAQPKPEDQVEQKEEPCQEQDKKSSQEA